MAVGIELQGILRRQAAKDDLMQGLACTWVATCVGCGTTASSTLPGSLAALALLDEGWTVAVKGYGPGATKLACPACGLI